MDVDAASPEPWPADAYELTAWATAFAEHVERADLPLDELLDRLAEVRLTGKVNASIEEWLLMLCRVRGATLQQLAEITAASAKYVNAPRKKLTRLAAEYGEAHDRLAALTTIYGTENPDMPSIDHETLDPEAVLGQYWPLNGPYGEWETRNAVSALYELVRYLNYATRYREAVPYPSVAGSVASNLASASGALDQALEQLTDRVLEFKDAPNLYGDDQPAGEQAHTSGVEHAERAAVKLAQARRDAHQLQQTLIEAAAHLNRLGLRDDEWKDEN